MGKKRRTTSDIRSTRRTTSVIQSLSAPRQFKFYSPSPEYFEFFRSTPVQKELNATKTLLHDAVNKLQHVDKQLTETTQSRGRIIDELQATVNALYNTQTGIRTNPYLVIERLDPNNIEVIEKFTLLNADSHDILPPSVKKQLGYTYVDAPTTFTGKAADITRQGRFVDTLKAKYLSSVEKLQDDTGRTNVKKIFTFKDDVFRYKWHTTVDNATKDVVEAFNRVANFYTNDVV